MPAREGGRGGPSLRTLIARIRTEIAEGGSDTAALDARVLVCHVLGLDAVGLVRAQDEIVAAADIRAIEALAARRRAGEPIAYLTGKKEFWGLDFQVSPAVLVPRPETELLVEAGLTVLAGLDAPRVLDLGTGSGCILVSLLTECPAAWGVGIDRSQAALAVAAANARAAGVGARAVFVCADWTAPLAARFDLVVANPPYLTQGELADASPDLGFEPRSALASGRDGLDAYRSIAAALAPCLKPGGLFLGEIGAGQADRILPLLTQAGLSGAACTADLAGLPRMVKARFLGD